MVALAGSENLKRKTKKTNVVTGNGLSDEAGRLGLTTRRASSAPLVDELVPRLRWVPTTGRRTQLAIGLTPVAVSRAWQPEKTRTCRSHTGHESVESGRVDRLVVRALADRDVLPSSSPDACRTRSRSRRVERCRVNGWQNKE